MSTSANSEPTPSGLQTRPGSTAGSVASPAPHRRHASHASLTSLCSPVMASPNERGLSYQPLRWHQATTSSCMPRRDLVLISLATGAPRAEQFAGHGLHGRAGPEHHSSVVAHTLAAP